MAFLSYNMERAMWLFYLMACWKEQCGYSVLENAGKSNVVFYLTTGKNNEAILSYDMLERAMWLFCFMTCWEEQCGFLSA